MKSNKPRLLQSEMGNETEEKKAKDEINRITEKSSSRERAIYTIMRQSGLPISRIQKLKIGDLERILDQNPPIPCRINTPTKNPTFIGYEAVKYTKEYLDKRSDEDKPTLKSLLFTATDNTKKEISTKSVSRTFNKNLKNSSGRQLRSLTKFYKTNTKNYQKLLKTLGKERDIESYRELYKKEAMPSLEIKLPTPMEMHQLEGQLARDSQYISSILSLLHSDAGDPKTHENEEIGDRLIDLWKELDAAQKKNLSNAYMGKAKLLPLVSPPKEIVKKLEQWLKPYRKQEEDANRR